MLRKFCVFSNDKRKICISLKKNIVSYNLPRVNKKFFQKAMILGKHSVLREFVKGLCKHMNSMYRCIGRIFYADHVRSMIRARNKRIKGTGDLART